MSELQPLCFVLMPFGRKKDPTGLPEIDFDRVYAEGIRPAIEAAGLVPLRADEEAAGGIIHKEMFERLLLCEFAVADLTTANANVFYELGVRHTARPATTQAIYARHQPIPFDVNFLRALPYSLGEANAFGPDEAAQLKQGLTATLVALRNAAEKGDTVDSPIFQLLGDWKPPDVAHMKTDLFREHVQANLEHQQRLADARAASSREAGLKSLRAIDGELRAQRSQSASVLVDLLLSYRALEAWKEMVVLAEAMPRELFRQVLVQEQLALALNRQGVMERNTALRYRALAILEGLNDAHGASSERGGLIGRIYKDFWEEALDADPKAARGYLSRAIDSYKRGFEADWRDPYPGVNVVTLLDIRGDDDSLRERDRLAPVVRFSATVAAERANSTYWDHATMLELAVLSSDQSKAELALERALAAVREPWEPKSTAKNLNLIARARASRSVEVEWIEAIVADLLRRGDG